MFGKEAGGERLLHAGGDEDTAFGVFGFGTAVESYAGTTGDLQEDGQGALETRGLRDGDAIDKCGDKVVGVFEGVADIMQTLNKEPGTLVDIMRGAVEFAVDGFVVRHCTNKFVVHRSKIFKNDSKNYSACGDKNIAKMQNILSTIINN